VLGDALSWKTAPLGVTDIITLLKNAFVSTIYTSGFKNLSFPDLFCKSSKSVIRRKV
jgi:hypothetical protein